MNAEQLKAVETTLEKALSGVEENLKGSVEEIVDQKLTAHLEKHNLTKEEMLKGKLPYGYKGEGENKKEVCANFVKSVFKGDVAAATKGMSEGVDSQGGFLVPEEFYSEVQRISEDYGLVSAFAAKFTMGSDKLNVPTGATSVTSYWTGEAANATASDATFDNAELNANRLTGLTILTDELLADAKVNTVDYLMELFGEEHARQLDDQAFNGTGSPFVGILNANSGVNVRTMASGQDTFAETTLADLRNLIADVKTSCLPTSAFFMHRSVWAIIQNIQENSQTVAAFQNRDINSGIGRNETGMLVPHGYLWGYPVYLSDTIVSATAVSTPFITFGSLPKGLFLGSRQDMKMDISNQATIAGVELFRTNQSAVRLSERKAIKVGLPGAFSNLRTAAS